MTRHIADRDHSEPGSARVRNFTRIEREERPSEASKILQTRPESREFDGSGKGLSGDRARSQGLRAGAAQNRL